MDKPNDEPLDKPEPDGQAKQSNYPKTRHSLIRRLQSDDPHVSILAIESFRQIYEEPIRLTLSRVCWEPELRGDLLQSFWERLVMKNPIRAFRGEGSFRGFLVKCLKTHVSDEFDKRNARKRGGSGRVSKSSDQDSEEKAVELPMDTADWERALNSDDWLRLTQPTTPADELEKAWIRAAIKSAAEDVRAAWKERDHELEFNVLLECLEAGEHGDLKAGAVKLNKSYDSIRQMNMTLKRDMQAALAWWQ